MKAMRAAVIFAALIVTCLPVLAQERQWTLDAAEEDAFLVLGVPETDDVGLSVWCKIGSQQPSLFYPVPWTNLAENAKVKVTADFGDKTIELDGTASASSDASTASIEMPLKIDSPFFDAMKSHDRVTLKLGTHSGIYPLLDADVAGLLRLCRQQQ